MSIPSVVKLKKCRPELGLNPFSCYILFPGVLQFLVWFLVWSNKGGAILLNDMTDALSSKGLQDRNTW